VFVDQDFPSVVVVGLGKRTAGVDDQENWHEGKENIRTAIAGYFAFDVFNIDKDSCGSILLRLSLLPLCSTITTLTMFQQISPY
jgi:hypothetical protein